MENGFQQWFLDPLAKGKPSLVGPYLYEDALCTGHSVVSCTLPHPVQEVT